jgi:hypothetical protein
MQKKLLPTRDGAIFIQYHYRPVPERLPVFCLLTEK